MINEKLATAMSEEMNFEFYSAYLYFGLSIRLDELRLSGMAAWMLARSREELDHGMEFYHFLNDSGVIVTLAPIQSPEIKADTPHEIFALALAHERKVTARLSEISSIAMEHHEFGVLAFMKSFHVEQRSEERRLDEIITHLEMAGNNNAALLFADRELAAAK